MGNLVRTAREGWLLILIVLAFTCGLCGASWALPEQCPGSYNNCTLPCASTRIHFVCSQAQGPPNCVCCFYEVTDYDCDGNGTTDCVNVVLVNSNAGDYQCSTSSHTCLVQTCQ